MNPSRLREAVAALGVILSLLLVAFEVRQNTEAVRGETLQGIAEMSLQVALAGFSEPDFLALYDRTLSGVDSMTSLETARFNWYYAGMMRVMENRYRQMNLGLIDNVAEVLGGGAGVYRHPYFRVYWEFARDQYPPDFRSWVDESFIPLIDGP